MFTYCNKSDACRTDRGSWFPVEMRLDFLCNLCVDVCIRYTLTLEYKMIHNLYEKKQDTATTDTFLPKYKNHLTKVVTNNSTDVQVDL